MSGVTHHVTVTTETDKVVRIGSQANDKYDVVDIHQAKCECGWKSPRRTRNSEAQDDAIEHQRYPDSRQ